MHAADIKSAELRRLTWRCRRGMLELDIVLQRFVKEYFDDLTLLELSALDELLELPDNDFWALVASNKITPKDADTLSVVNKIRAIN